MKKIILIITTLLLSSTLNAQEVNNNEALKNKIDTYLNQGVSNGFSGAILIEKEGQIILNKGYGMADKENHIPYKSNTISSVGSVTKQFTATAILKLVEFNKLKVKDPISNFFKNIPKDKKDITIHQLLTHSSGLIDVIGDGDFDNISQKKFFKTLFATKLLHQPGSKYAYSNSGYSILARIIEIASGKDYEYFLNEHLFKPAGMDQTGYFIPQWKDNLIAKGYVHSLVGIGTMLSQYKRMGKITWTLKGNGGIHSTPEDMYKWYRALKSNKILSKSMFEKLTTPYVQEQEEGLSHYAYGWVIFNSNRSTKIISHNGGNGAFFHDFIWLPEDDVLIILFTNTGSRENEVAWPIEKMIFEKDYQANPIKKSLHLLVSDFAKNNSLKSSHELISIIKEGYLPTIKKPYYLNGLGYDLLKNRIGDIPNNKEWALEIFKLNVERFPTSGNIWDSLGESYLANGQKEEALKSYKKALDLGSDLKECSWCKSSRNAIKKISKMK